MHRALMWVADAHVPCLIQCGICPECSKLLMRLDASLVAMSHASKHHQSASVLCFIHPASRPTAAARTEQTFAFALLPEYDALVKFKALW